MFGQMVKQSYTDKITQRSVLIHTHKKRKRKNIYISLFPKSTVSILGFAVYSGIPQMHQVDCGDLIRCS